MKDPAILFYTSDFLTGVACLTMEERGQYITLLCLQREQGHLSEKQMKTACGGTVCADVLSKFQQDEDGLFYQHRMDVEMQKRAEHSKRQRKNIAKRWNTADESDAESVPCDIPNVYQTDTKDIPNAYQTVYQTDTKTIPLGNGNINININNNKSYGEKLDGKIKDWFAYKGERAEYPTPLEKKELYEVIDNQLVNGESYIIGMISLAMSNGYKGIQWKPPDRPPKSFEKPLTEEEKGNINVISFGRET